MKVGIIGAGRIGKVHAKKCDISNVIKGVNGILNDNDKETPVTGMDGLYLVLMAASVKAIMEHC